MTLFIATLVLVVLVIMIAIELAVLRARKRRKKVAVPKHARRQVLLEDRMHTALAEPTQQYGEIFSSFMIWKLGRETRMELNSTGPWRQLNEFTRSLVVRHIWRALERLSKGSVVIVDVPPQEWSAVVNESFDDHGIDPWAEVVAKPQRPPEPEPPLFTSGP
jgi:hypothetical protein